MPLYLRFPVLASLFLSLTLAACAAKNTPGSGYSGPVCQDVISMPQDLNMYAYETGVNVPLAAPQEQIAAAGRQKQAFYRPWRAAKPSKWVEQASANNFNMRPGNAYAKNNRPFPQELWDRIEANTNKGAFGSGHGPGITLRNTNLRAMPTSEHFYRNPELPGEGYPFDYFQHSSLHAGTPVYICGISRDGQWLLVESSITSGWLPAADIGTTDAPFMQRWEALPLASLVRDNVSIAGTNNHIGTLLPIAGQAPKGRGHVLSVLFPVAGGSGKADILTEVLPPDTAVSVPLNMTPGEVAKVGNAMMGQTYGWGGLDQKRDCSALTRDIMAPFGYFLPRNSAAQSKVGTTIDIAGLEPDEKERAIMREAVPFASLIWLRGHIGLYTGQYNGNPSMFHNIWGLRTKGGSGDCSGRAVIGKAVVTSLRPGQERPDLCPSGLLILRMEKVAVLASPSSVAEGSEISAVSASGSETVQ